jgi:hypothetical protein
MIRVCRLGQPVFSLGRLALHLRQNSGNLHPVEIWKRKQHSQANEPIDNGNEIPVCPARKILPSIQLLSPSPAHGGQLLLSVRRSRIVRIVMTVNSAYCPEAVENHPRSEK